MLAFVPPTVGLFRGTKNEVIGVISVVNFCLDFCGFLGFARFAGFCGFSKLSHLFLNLVGERISEGLVIILKTSPCGFIGFFISILVERSPVIFSVSAL